MVDGRKRATIGLWEGYINAGGTSSSQTKGSLSRTRRRILDRLLKAAVSPRASHVAVALVALPWLFPNIQHCKTLRTEHHVLIHQSDSTQLSSIHEPTTYFYTTRRRTVSPNPICRCDR